jgi:hypothetical protein
LRRFFFYRWSHSDWSSDYLPVTYEFEIRGSADQWGSYTLLKEHGGNGDTDGISLAYQYGENIVDIMLANEVYRWFHSKSFDYEIAADGRIWVWASGPEACIQVSVETVDREMSLSIIAKPFLVQKPVGRPEDGCIDRPASLGDLSEKRYPGNDDSVGTC